MNILFYTIVVVAAAILIAYFWTLVFKKCNIYYINLFSQVNLFGYLKLDKISNRNELHSTGSFFMQAVCGNVVDEDNNAATVYQRNSINDDYYEQGEKKGTVDQTGNIKDLNNQVIAHCDPIGKRWYGLIANITPGVIMLILAAVAYLFKGFNILTQSQITTFTYVGISYLLIGLVISYFTFSSDVFVADTTGNPSKEKLGYVTELRFRNSLGINQMTRAAACLALYEEEVIDSEQKTGAGWTPSVSAKDLAFTAMLIFVLVFSVFSFLFTNYDLFSAVGSILSYTVSMVMVYCMIWWLLYMLKTDFATKNITFISLLQLINRNTGITGWNIFLIFISALGAILSLMFKAAAGGYVLFPLYLVVCFATVYNYLVFPDKPWNLSNTLSDLIKPDNRTRRARTLTLAPTGNLKNIEFNWDLSNIQNLNTDEVVKISGQVNADCFEGTTPLVRQKNPFYGEETDSSGQAIPKWKKAWNFDNSKNPPVGESLNFDNFSKMINEVVKNSPDDSQDVLIAKIIEATNKVVQKYNLASYELFNLITNFCQYQIKYEADGQSASIGQGTDEYVRFPIETLFDREGDCDCYAALVYKIFRTLNTDKDDVKYAICDVTGVQKHAFLLVKKDGSIPLSPGVEVLRVPGLSGEYAFCEATSRGWVFGVNSGFDLSDIKIVA